MSVFRVNKTKDYTVMSNYHFKEKEMSLKAKGLLSMMLSLPDDWDYSIAGLVAICKENETAIKSALKELSEFGYVRIDKITPDKTESGRFEYVYNIFEKPQKQAIEKQGIENLPLENLQVENRIQLNTKELNTKELNTKKRKTRVEKYLDSILAKLEEYNFSDKSKEKILEFYEMWANNKVLHPLETVEKQLTLLANETEDAQISSINKSITNGWKSPIYESNKTISKKGFEDSAKQDFKSQDIQRNNIKGKGVEF